MTPPIVAVNKVCNVSDLSIQETPLRGQCRILTDFHEIKLRELYS